jgi:hypothetical protein
MKDVKIHIALILTVCSLLTQACNQPASIQQSVTTQSGSNTAATLFASGTKVIKINTNDLTGVGSFSVPTAMPAPTVVPPSLPGYDGVSTYLPGISAATYYAADGVTVIAQPSWLLDFQLGITGLPGATTCATFGGSGSEDVSGYYRTSEADCGASNNSGTGNNNDPVFIRIILNRASGVIGTAENLLVQVEYQASALHLNSDGISNNPENNLDQLWKVFWNTSLLGSSTPSVFSMFIPPNYAACVNGGSGTTGAPGNCVSGYPGAPDMVKQMIIPISSYSTLTEIQISRMAGRVNNTTDTFPGSAPSPGPVNYVAPFFSTSSVCQSGSPLCLGVVIRSVMLMRM